MSDIYKYFYVIKNCKINVSNGEFLLKKISSGIDRSMKFILTTRLCRFGKKTFGFGLVRNRKKDCSLTNNSTSCKLIERKIFPPKDETIAAFNDIKDVSELV